MPGSRLLNAANSCPTGVGIFYCIEEVYMYTIALVTLHLIVGSCVGFTFGYLIPLSQYLPFNLDMLVFMGSYYFIAVKFYDWTEKRIRAEVIAELDSE